MTPGDLAGISLFEGLPGWALERLARSATRRHLGEGDLVVRQNDEARALYMLLDDTVQTFANFEGVGGLLMGVEREPGSLIGWSAFRPPYRFTDSVRCEGPTELLRLPRETLEEIFEEDPYLGYRILKRVATTVDKRLEGALASLENPTTID